MARFSRQANKELTVLWRKAAQKKSHHKYEIVYLNKVQLPRGFVLIILNAMIARFRWGILSWKITLRLFRETNLIFQLGSFFAILKAVFL